MPETLSGEARRLIYRMLEVDPKRRITAREVIFLSHLNFTVSERAMG